MDCLNCLSLLPPVTKLRQGNVFTPVCHSVHGGRGSLSQHAAHDQGGLSGGGGLCLGVSIQEGLSRGVSVQAGVSVREGGVCPGGLCPGEVSCPGGLCLCPGGLCPGGSQLGIPPPDRDPRRVW